MRSSPQSIWLGMVAVVCLAVQAFAIDVGDLTELSSALATPQSESILLTDNIDASGSTMMSAATNTVDVGGFTLTSYSGWGSTDGSAVLTITSTSETPGTFAFTNLTMGDAATDGLSSLALNGLTMNDATVDSVLENQSTAGVSLSLTNSSLARKSLTVGSTQGGAWTLAVGAGSTLAMDTFTQTGNGTTQFNLQDGGMISVTNDLTLDDKTFLSMNAAATSGGTLTVGGTLTLDRDLTVAEGTASPVNALNAGKIKMATTADSNVALEVTDGKTVETSEITGAQVSGSHAEIQVSEASTLNVLKNEDSTGGDVSLGAENGGNVNVSVTGNSAFSIANNATLQFQEGDTVSVSGSDATDPDNVVRSLIYVGNNATLHAHGSGTITVSDGGSFSAANALETYVKNGEKLTFVVDGANATDPTVVSQVYAKSFGLHGENEFTLQNGGTLGIGSDTAFSDNVTFSTNASATSGGVVNASGFAVVLNRNLTLADVSGATTNTLSALYADSLHLAHDANANVTFTVQDGKVAQYGSVVGAEGAATTLNINVTDGAAFGAYVNEENTAWTGNMTLGKADGTGGDWNLNVSDRGTVMVAGDFKGYLTDDSTFTVDGKRGDLLDYSVYIGGAAEITAVETKGEVNVTNGGLIHITGTLTSGGAMKYVLDGEGVSNYSDGEKTMPSAIVAGGLALETNATAEFQLINGGTLDFTNDTTLGEGVKIVMGGSGAVNGPSLLLAQDYNADSTLKNVNLTLGDGLELTLADGATNGGRLVVSNGTLTVNMDKLTVADGANSPVNELSAKTIQLAQSAGSDTTFEVTDGKVVQVGQISGAETAGTKATVQVASGSTLGAYVNESDTSWTGNVTLGVANGGSVNLSVTDGSTFLAANAMNVNTQGGDHFTIDGSRVSTDSEGKETIVTSSLTGDTVSIYANNGTATNATIVDVTNGGQIYGTQSISIGANSGGYLRGSFTGKTNADNTVTNGYLASGANAIVGGAGRTELEFTNGGVLNANNITLGDTVGGNVVVGVVGSTSNITTFQNETTDGSGNTTKTGGDIVVGNAGTANVGLSSGAQMIAAGSLVIGKAGTGTVEMENAVLQSGGILLGANTGSNGTLDISGKSSAVYVQANTLTSTTTNGTGTLNVTDLKQENASDAWSGVYLNAGSGIYLNGNANFDHSILFFGISSDDEGNVTKSNLSTGTGTSYFKDGAVIAGTPTFTGNVNIDRTSSFQMGITVAGGSEAMTINDGSLTIADGAKLDLYMADSGTLSANTWTVANIVTDDTGYAITGNWDISSPIPFYKFSQNISSDAHTMTISAETDSQYFEKRYPNANFNENAVLKFMETYPDSWYDTLLNIAYGTDEQLRNTVAQMTGSVRANSMMLARQSLWVPVQDRISWDESCQAYLGPQNPFNHSNEYSSFWFQTGYRGRSVDPNAGLSGYDVNSFQLSLGVDRVFESYLAGGVFFHFGNPDLDQDYAHAQAHNYSVGAYFGYKMFGGFELKGMGAYTVSDYDLERYMDFFFDEGKIATSSYKGDTLTLSLELARPFFFGTFVLRPTIAIDNENVWQNEAIEYGAGMYSMVYDRSSGSWTFARFGVVLDYALSEQFTLKGRASYSKQLDGTEGSTLLARYRGTTHHMAQRGTFAGDDYMNVGITGQYSFGTTHTTTLFGTYDAYLSNEMTSHYVNAGIQFAF